MPSEKAPFFGIDSFFNQTTITLYHKSVKNASVFVKYVQSYNKLQVILLIFTDKYYRINVGHIG